MRKWVHDDLMDGMVLAVSTTDWNQGHTLENRVSYSSREGKFATRFAGYDLSELWNEVDGYQAILHQASGQQNGTSFDFGDVWHGRNSYCFATWCSRGNLIEYGGGGQIWGWWLNSNIGIMLWRQNNNNLVYFHQNNSVTVANPQNPEVVSFVACYDGATLKRYFNGELHSTANLAPPTKPNTGQWQTGQYDGNYAARGYFLDGLYGYNPWSDAQVRRFHLLGPGGWLTEKPRRRRFKEPVGPNDLVIDDLTFGLQLDEVSLISEGEVDLTVENLSFGLFFDLVELSSEDSLIVDSLTFGLQLNQIGLSSEDSLTVDNLVFGLQLNQIGLSSEDSLTVDNLVFGLQLNQSELSSEDSLTVDSLTFGLQLNEAQLSDIDSIFAQSLTFGLQLDQIELSSEDSLIVDNLTFGFQLNEVDLSTVKVIDPESLTFGLLLNEAQLSDLDTVFPSSLTFGLVFDEVILASEDTLIVDNLTFGLVLQQINLQLDIGVADGIGWEMLIINNQVQFNSLRIDSQIQFESLELS